MKDDDVVEAVVAMMQRPGNAAKEDTSAELYSRNNTVTSVDTSFLQDRQPYPQDIDEQLSVYCRTIVQKTKKNKK